MIVINTLQCGGAERFVERLSSELIDDVKITVVVFTTEKQYFELDKKITVIDLKRTNSFDILRVCRGIRSAVKTTKPDAILSVMSSVTFQTVLSLIGIRNIKLYARECVCHNKLLSGVNKILHKILLPICLQMCNGVICQSNGAAKELIKYFYVPTKKITVINNLINTSKIRLLSEDNVEHRWFNENNFVIVSCANFSKYKDHCTLLKAMYALKMKTYNLKLILLGDGDLRHHLEKLTHDLRLDNIVDFVGQVKTPFSYFKKSDLFILSSKTEAFPNVVIEAMACGVPVISSDCDYGPREIINDGVNGRLFAVGDYVSLAGLIEDTINNKNLYKDMARIAFDDINKKFSKDIIVNQYKKVLFNE
jgi:glycosyltransferase involved in cell wall biosynthesis